MSEPVTQTDFMSTHKVLEALRENLRSADMDDEAETVKEAHNLVQEYENIIG